MAKRGRPPLGKIKVGIKLLPEVDFKLEAICKATGLRKSTVISEAILRLSEGGETDNRRI